MTRRDRNRRELLAGSAAASGAIFASLAGAAHAQNTSMQPTPRCDDEPTVRQTEGPFYSTRSPQRRVLRERGTPGTHFTLIGLVVTRSCRPIPNTLVDLWQADDTGNYDNQGFTLRGHQFTDANGRYSFETIIPGVYPGRTRHFHVKYQPRGGRVLTTQLYFPGEPENRRDSLFSPRLLLDVVEQPRSGTFVTVLDIA